MSSKSVQADVGTGQHQAEILSLAESLSSFVALIQGDELIYVNPAACTLLGRSRESLLGRSLCQMMHPEDREDAKARATACIEGCPKTRRLTERFVHADGHAVWLDYAVDLVQFEGRPTTLVTGHDVTERVNAENDRRRAEEALRQSEERFRNLCEQAPVMLMSFAPDGRVREVSNYWLQKMGYAREEIVDHDGWRLLTADSRERLQRTIAENERSRQNVIRNFPLQAIRKDGTTVDLLATSVAQSNDRGEPLGAICVEIDLTDLQRAEAALRESEERYRALVEHAPEAITVVDVDTGLFVDANACAVKLFGFSREQLLSMGPLDFCNEVQEEGRTPRDVIEEENRRVLAGENPVFEFTHVTADGREIQCQTRLSRLPAAGRRLIRASTLDVTELKQLEARVRHTDRLAAAGTLAAGVAHEIGNPLMALSMAAQSLERRSCDAYTSGKLALIQEHIDRISRIVRQMSELARPQSGRRSSCDVNEIVRRSIDMVRYDQRARSSEIRFELAPALPPVEAVEDELVQVCINLALNAFDAMAKNPDDRPRRLTIRSSATDSHVRVAFQDTGPGVPPELRDKVFQPFFTTKDAGGGSGLGLSVSYRILADHKGVLRLDPDAQGGAAFVFELPRASSP